MAIKQDPHVAALYRAIALRFYCRYADMRDHASMRGGDIPDHGRYQTEREADERYGAAIEEAIHDTPESAEAALALVEFAGVLAADRLVGELMREPVNDERDAYHQSIALAAAAGWLNKACMEEYAERHRLAVVPSGDDGDAA